MNHHFDDIKSKLGVPHWYDTLGYPRYCKFEPNLTSNIYANIACLVKLGCQGCNEEMYVGVSLSTTSLMFSKLGEELKGRLRERTPLSDFVFTEVGEKFIRQLTKEDWCWLMSWGDPPNHGCVGDTMSSYALKIEECWIQNKISWKWERHPEYEMELETKD